MKLLRVLKAAAVCTACCGILIPQQALLAADSAPPVNRAETSNVPVILDIALSDGGTVAGRVVDATNQGVDGAIVSIREGDKEVAATHANKNGVFVVRGLRGGLYHVVTGGGHGLFRFWAPKTAPPKAMNKVMLVSNAVVVRGQSDVLYDEQGNAYGRVRIVDTGGVAGATYVSGGAVGPPPMAGGGVYPAGWSGGLFGGLDIITLTTVSAAIGAVVLGALILDDINDDLVTVVPASP